MGWHHVWLDKAFEEAQIKRKPKGSKGGGQFTAQGGGAGSAGTQGRQPRAKKLAEIKIDAAFAERLLVALDGLHPDLARELGAKVRKNLPTLAGKSGLIAGPIRKVVTPDGKMEVDAQPQLIELADLLHAKGDLQPRNRGTAESRTTARERASNLDPEQLQPGRVSDAGAPIVAADGTVISGNGRVMSLREVYQDKTFAARMKAYRASLGIMAADMKEPVLVMRLSASMDHKSLAELADRSNRSRIESMSATERARRDAKAAGLEVMGLYRGGNFTAPENRAFLQAFTQKAMTANERTQFSKEGRLTKEGQDRLSAAVLASAYDNVDALSMMLESTDDNVRSITNAMKDTAGRFAELKAAIAAGTVLPQMDITGKISDAAMLISSLRSKGVSPASHFAQTNMFGDTDPLTEALVKAFYNDSLSRALSQQRVAAILSAYAEEAEKHRPGGFLPDKTKATEVIAIASRKGRTEEPGQQKSLFSAAA